MAQPHIQRQPQRRITRFWLWETLFDHGPKINDLPVIIEFQAFIIHSHGPVSCITNIAATGYLSLQPGVITRTDVVDAMILAAGRGERMRPLTDTLPKPLLPVGDYPLIEHHIRKLAKADFVKCIINVAWLPELIPEYLGDGSRFGIDIRYSLEADGALGTAGGIVHALDNIEGRELLVINGDIFTDFDFTKLALPQDSAAHLALVDNPPHHLQGDFCLEGGRIERIGKNSGPAYTFSGIGLYRREIFEALPVGRKMQLKTVFDELISQDAMTGEHTRSMWIDVGDPERLRQARDVAG